MDELKVILKIAGLDTRQDVHPVFGDNVKLKITRAENQIFRREKLDGKFQFVGEDFDLISGCGSNVQFTLEFYRGESFVGRGTFYRTDCKMDYDNKVCEINLTTTDRYETIMNNLDNKYNLVKLAPKIETARMNRRAVLQLYVKGEKIISNIVGGMHFEQDCTEVNSGTDLVQKYHFASALPLAYINISSVTDSSLQNAVGIYAMSQSTSGAAGAILYENGKGYRIQYTDFAGTAYFLLNDLSDGTPSGKTVASAQVDSSSIGLGVTNLTFKGINSEISVTKGYGTYNKDGDLYTRVLSPVNITTHSCFPRTSDDITEYDSNYPYVAPISGDAFTPRMVMVGEKSDTPTPWGIDSNMKYFKFPTLTDAQKQDGVSPIPVGQSHWGLMSTWLLEDDYLKDLLDSFNSEFVLKDAFSVSNAIKTLLKEVDPSIHFEEDYSYSAFLAPWYSSTAIDAYPFPHSRKARLFITPITNIKKTRYEQAAQRGDMSLKQMFDMLRNVFQCYWWIDDSNNLHIEHIAYFKNGMTYVEGLVNPQIDLTKMYSMPPSKTWDYNSNVVSGKKSKCPSRYEFNWGDTVTEQFNGVAIDILDKYIDSSKKEKITVNNFVSDIDYAIINPSGMGDDLYAIFEANENSKLVEIPNIRLGYDTPKYKMQNGFVSFLFAEVHYYPYDLGGWKAKAEDTVIFVHGTKAFKSQSLSFPVTLAQAREIGMIRSSAGIGEVESLEVEVDSLAAKVEVNYPEEQDLSEDIRVYYTPSMPNRNGWIQNLTQKTVKVTYALYNDTTKKIESVGEKVLRPDEEYRCFTVIATNPRMVKVLRAEDVTFVKIGSPMFYQGGIMDAYLIPISGSDEYRVNFQGNQRDGVDWGVCSIVARQKVHIMISASTEENYDYAWAHPTPCLSTVTARSAKYHATGQGGVEFDLEAGESICIGYTKDSSRVGNRDEVDFYISKL